MSEPKFKVGDMVVHNEGEEAKDEVERLKAELAKATEEADARVVAILDELNNWPSSRGEFIAKHRPKPKFVWTMRNDADGNTTWNCNGIRTVIPYLKDNAMAWYANIPYKMTFTDLDLAKAAVERYLTEGER